MQGMNSSNFNLPILSWAPLPSSSSTHGGSILSNPFTLSFSTPTVKDPRFSKATPLPGHGLGLDEIPDDGDDDSEHPLPTLLNPNAMRSYRSHLPLLHVKELAMLRFMNFITDNPQWASQVGNPGVLAGWKVDALHSNEHKGVTDQLLDECFEELKLLAPKYQKDVFGVVPVYNGGVVKSDLAVMARTREALLAAVKPLENVPYDAKDWQPNSYYKVVNLVDPNLYPLIYGRTKAIDIGEDLLTLDNCIAKAGEGTVLPPQGKPPSGYGALSQWLPCDVLIGTGTAKIQSYINNLHPTRHSDLYRCIEEVISAAIPLWDQTLAPLADDSFDPSKRIHGMWKDQNRGRGRQFQAPRQPQHFSLIDKYGKNGIPLQIIVKLETIELTPSKPKFLGGKWHLEGTMNEHIVATAVYDYSCHNIMHSSTSFRHCWKNDEVTSELHQTFAEDAEVPPWLYSAYRINKYQPMIQWIGGIETRQGRLVTYSNIVQTKIEPFSLANFKEPGHRKMLVLYLVDPNIRVVSTSNVPWQQFGVRREDLMKIVVSGHRQKAKAGLHRLPVELLEVVLGYLEGNPITVKESREYRLKIIEEREKLSKDHIDRLTSYP